MDKKEQISTRKSQQERNELLASYKELRRRGILTRQEFRLMTFDKGLQGSTKGSPMITTYDIVKTGGKKELVVKTKQWTRI